MLKRTIVVGVDPAPSKGLCVYAHYPVNFIFNNENKFQTYYGPVGGDLVGSDLEDFSKLIKELSISHPVLICWDAPLTMPSDHYRREIEKLAEPKPKLKPEEPEKQNPYSKESKPERKKWFETREKKRREVRKNEKRNMASVQPVAKCPHWIISQYVIGHPRFGEASPDMGLDTKLIFDVDDINKNGSGIYLTEVHPALAIQVRIGRNRIRKFKAGGKLSGEHSYKDVKWIYNEPSKPDLREEFQKLLIAVKSKFGKRCQALDDIFPTVITNWFKPEACPTLDPSDHLDAWVAMRLGVLWIEGKLVRCYGNKPRGSFLLPNKEFAAAEEHEDLDRIDAV